MKILVTGGAGFIGRYLVDFLSKNHKITIYDNLSNSSRDDIEPLLEKGVKFVNSDILDYENLKKACVGFDLIIHLAAKSNVAESAIHPEITNEVNIAGTKNVMQCCIDNKIKKIIFASSAAVYDDSKIPVNENAKTNPSSPYGKSKLVGEQIIKTKSQELETSAIILRMFNVYGSGQKIGVISKFIKNISQEKPFQINGDGKQTRDFISIFDVVTAFDCAIKKIEGKRGETFNVGSGNSISINELSQMIQKISGKKIEINFNPQSNYEIKQSLADVKRAENELDFIAKRNLEDELRNLILNL